ncbi:MAG: hypothetical protein II754_00710 [Lachnospiraceae bacterium]|nr:hypothetical protein [Lachnospiraceae bacterium]
MRKKKAFEEGQVITIHDLPKGKKIKKKKAQKTEAKNRVKAAGFLVLAILISAALGIGAAFLAAACNHEGFRVIRHWPIIVSVFVFSLSSIGFFSSHKEAEKLYGIFLALSAVCIAAELIMMFR